ncbi:MAG: putative phospholipid ABC transporter permease protein MlaE [Chlamydiae bacterium]|nr:putative phospholipid ABC transporter permease protein MlaE [Chlamydiota bacterium]
MSFYLGKVNFLAATGEYVLLIWNVTLATFRRPPPWSLIREQLYNIGVLSLPVVAMTGFSTGLVLAAQSFFQLSDKGLAGATGLMVGKAMITELGPILTAFMVTGRVGAAMCAELGTMRVTEQIDALETMAVNPHRFLISPRFISGMVMMPLLTVFSIFMGIFGGYLISIFYFGMAPTTYFDPMPIYINNFDLLIGIVKAFVFGVLIITISCYKGLNTSGGAEGVGRSTTNSVVICYTFILITNFLITIGLNILQDATGWFT